MWPVAVAKRPKNDRNFHTSNWLFAQTIHVDVAPLKFCMQGRVPEVVIYFKFHKSRLRGVGAVGVENRPLPLTRPMAYTTACATVQAVMRTEAWQHWLYPLRNGDRIPVWLCSGPALTRPRTHNDWRKEYETDRRMLWSWRSTAKQAVTVFVTCAVMEMSESM